MKFISSFASGHKLPSQACERSHFCSCLLLQAICGMLSKGVRHPSKLVPEGRTGNQNGQQLCCWSGVAVLILILMALKDSLVHVGGKEHSQWAASY